MDKTIISVFTSPTCPFCPAAKQVAKEVAGERDDVEIKEFNSATPEGRKQSIKLGIQTVPTVHVQGPKHPEILGFQGAPSKKRLMHAVNVTQGIEDIEEPKSMMDKIRSVFS